VQPGHMLNDPQRRPDPFVDAVASVRDYVLHIIEVASWRLTFAAGFALASRLAWPLLPDDVTTRGLLGLTALSLGACVGRVFDRQKRMRR
jgi:hypothetical protein